MLNYKEKTINLGGSDMATILLRGFRDGEGEAIEKLYFPEDGGYDAYLTEDLEEIPTHYKLDHTFQEWLWIYDDEGRTNKLRAKNIEIYTAGDYGVIINLRGSKNEQI